MCGLLAPRCVCCSSEMPPGPSVKGPGWPLLARLLGPSAPVAYSSKTFLRREISALGLRESTDLLSVLPSAHLCNELAGVKIDC